MITYNGIFDETLANQVTTNVPPTIYTTSAIVQTSTNTVTFTGLPSQPKSFTAYITTQVSLSRGKDLVISVVYDGQTVSCTDVILTGGNAGNAHYDEDVITYTYQNGQLSLHLSSEHVFSPSK